MAMRETNPPAVFLKELVVRLLLELEQASSSAITSQVKKGHYDYSE